MLLSEILAFCQLPAVQSDLEITGVTSDSRKIGQGFLFAALPGLKADGIAFLDQAQKSGAVAAFVPENAVVKNSSLTIIPCADPRKTYALACAAFYGKQPETIVAVTGTNGKTSTANFARQIWDFLGKKAASVGTLGVLTNEFSVYGSMTTPDPATLHEELKNLADKSYDHAAIEASSHGIEQHRVSGVRLAAAGFTNITRDHLDYHKTMENYLNAKLGLFDEPLSCKTAVLNADIAEYPEIRSYCEKRGLKIIDYGKKAKAIRLTDTDLHIDGQTLTLDLFGKSVTVHLPLAGTFQAMNALCALGLVVAAGEDPYAAVKALETFKGAAGRLEYVGTRKNGGSVYVDYAHTPDALETVLNALRPHTKNKLAVVFGCGGDRDNGKRPQMGKICNELADLVFVTDDNPRSEEPTAIRDMILPACPAGSVIGNRALAIRTAVAAIGEGDILVIAGKGHEIGQIVKGVTHHFDDREETRAAIAEADAPLWTASEIAAAVNGKIEHDFAIDGVSIDTRTLKKGDLFVAIKGEKLDGADYAAQAMEKGAAGVLACVVPAGVSADKTILVPDALKGLEQMAKAARARTKAKIIGITGSSGKTSTKEMLRTALTGIGKTHWTQGNLNNNIGMPLTLARLPKNADFAVIEMGMNHAGEMTELTRLARPDIVIVTMIGSAHCEFFKTKEDTARAKAEIFKGMNKDGIVFLNKDGACFDLLKAEALKNGLTDIRSFGTKTADVALKESGEKIKVEINGKPYAYTLKLSGAHQVSNSLAVAGVLDALRVDMAEALQSLGQLRPSKGRGERFDIALKNGETFTLIDDAYNANPDSMQAAIRVLGSIVPAANGRRVALIGDMLELGDQAEALHKKLRADLIENKVNKVYAVGQNSAALFDTLPPEMKGEKCQTSAELVSFIENEIKSGDVVLVKGSFGSKMTLIVEKLKSIS